MPAETAVTIHYPDISSFQGNILLRGAPAACIKATQGTGYSNPYYGSRMGGARQTGVLGFAYHFLEAGNAAAQAAHCHSVVRSTPVMLDVEVTGNSRPRTGDVYAFIDAFRKAGGTLHLCYLPHWYWSEIGSPDLKGLRDRHVLLVSSAYPSSGYSDRGAGWAAYGGSSPVVWQWTDKHPFNGQRVDFNAYKGTIAEFRNLIFSGSAKGGLVAGHHPAPAKAPAVKKAPPQTADMILARAASQLRYREGATTPYGTWYQNVTHSAGFASAPWCDMFVSWVADQCGMKDLIGRFAYVPYHMADFRRRGLWHDGAGGIRRGDVIVFDWEHDSVPDHIGYVEHADGSGIHTIEGNTGSPQGVWRVTRQANVVKGYGRPRYHGAGGAAPSAPPRPSAQHAPPWPGTYLRATTRGHGTRAWQQRMAARGWRIAVDDVYGPASAGICRQFQAEKRLGVDGVVGPVTWKAAWEAPVT